MASGGSDKTTTTTRLDPAITQKYNELWKYGKEGLSEYTPYTGETVAGLNDTQNLAEQIGTDYASSASGFDSYGLLNKAGNTDIGSLAGADLSAYLNPYTDQVVNNTLQNIDESRLKALQGVGDNAISAGAFGGDRQGIVEAETNRQYGDLAAETSAGLWKDNYSQAQTAAQQDIANKLTQAGLESDVASKGISGQTTSLSQLSDLGKISQNTTQSQLDALLSKFTEQRDWGKNEAQYLAGLLSGTPYGQTQTQTGKSDDGGSGILGGMLGLLSLL